MCFNRQTPPPMPAATPAAAPPVPDPTAENTSPEANRQKETIQNYGTPIPGFRIDRTTTQGGTGAGGSGIRV